MSGRNIPCLRDCVAHVLQLCEYVEDGATGPQNVDYTVLVLKAAQIRHCIEQLYEDGL
jgi:hypothetical protein